MEQTYYEKIMLSSGEVPEEGEFVTDISLKSYFKDGLWYGWWYCETHETFAFGELRPKWYMKPVTLPSNKEEAVLFVEWKDKNYVDVIINGERKYSKTHDAITTFTLSELYDKFKLEKGESK